VNGRDLVMLPAILVLVVAVTLWSPAPPRQG